MATAYQETFADRLFLDGEARGNAQAVLEVLAARGVAVTDDVRGSQPPRS